MKFKIGDMLVYAFIIVVMGFSLLGLKWLSESTSGRLLVVEVGGREVESLKLAGDKVPRDIRVDTGGGGYNILHISEEGVGITEANCPDQICVRSGKISIPGQTIICLPHKLIIRIAGDAGDENNIDSTAS